MFNQYGFDKPCNCINRGLGAAELTETDLVIRNIMDSARSLFPEQTAEFENWVSARAMNYGIDYAQYKAKQAYGALTDLVSSPIALLGLGLFAGWMIFKR
jgi:hypothetical protein